MLLSPLHAAFCSRLFWLDSFDTVTEICRDLRPAVGKKVGYLYQTPSKKLILNSAALYNKI
jgi:hypothetical protein